MTVDVIIPSYRPGERFYRLLSMLKAQETPVNRIIVINTEEKYWDPEKYRFFPNLEVRHITKKQFDHGAVRNMGISFSKADIVVCMTDDAVPADRKLITALTEGFSGTGPSGETIIEVYARQLPGPECGEAEKYTRQFNYPETSRIKTIKDLERLGIKTYFASDVCCAYRRAEFEKLGGFISRTIFNEDMIFAAKALKAGYAVRYEAGAQVIHSHNYTPMQQLHRNFDLGVSQAQYPDIFRKYPSEGEGIRMVKQTAAHVWEIRRPWLLVPLFFQSGFKYLGYQLGKHYRVLPRGIILRCTSNKTWWRFRKKRKKKGYSSSAG